MTHFYSEYDTCPQCGEKDSLDRIFTFNLRPQRIEDLPADQKWKKAVEISENCKRCGYKDRRK